MKATTRTINPKKALPVLGGLLLLSFFLLLSCDDVGSDDEDDPKLSYPVFAGDASSGDKDGQGIAAQFNRPLGLVLDSSGNLYVADTGNNRIRKITPLGTVTTIVSGATAVEFNGPYGVALDPSGNLYVTDTGNHRIRKITPLGVVSTLAGSDSGASGIVDMYGNPRFSSPTGIAIASGGQTLYVTEFGNNKIRKITLSATTATVTIPNYVERGSTIAAQFTLAYGVALDAAGNLYVADTSKNRIRKIDASGMVSTLAGSDSRTRGVADGQGTAARFNSPQGIAVASSGTVYVADTGNNSIRKVTSDGAVTTIAKDLDAPKGIALSPDGSTAYVTSGNLIYKLSNL